MGSGDQVGNLHDHPGKHHIGDTPAKYVAAFEFVYESNALILIDSRGCGRLDYP